MIKCKKALSRWVWRHDGYPFRGQAVKVKNKRVLQSLRPGLGGPGSVSKTRVMVGPLGSSRAHHFVQSHWGKEKVSSENLLVYDISHVWWKLSLINHA